MTTVLGARLGGVGGDRQYPDETIWLCETAIFVGGFK
jgi:hypothetical protein